MKKFFVLFCVPSAAIAEWMKTTDEATRTQQSQEMMESWQKWITAHEGAILDKGLPLGKTKRVTDGSIADTKNDLNWYLVVEAESHEAAANMFSDHPHLHIPSSYIEVMDASRTGM
jgi:hypothetical protein